MNLTHPFTNIPPDDADHLLYMVEQAHRPFADRPISIGDVADQWIRRWQRSQPRTKTPVAHSLNPPVLALREMYRPRQEGPPEVPSFTFEQAVAALQTRWPGILMGIPAAVMAGTTRHR